MKIQWDNSHYEYFLRCSVCGNRHSGDCVPCRASTSWGSGRAADDDERVRRDGNDDHALELVIKCFACTFFTPQTCRGRWGKDDEIGTMNLLTPETRKAALATVRDYELVSLSRTLMFNQV